MSSAQTGRATRPVPAPRPGIATERMLPGQRRFCARTAWSAAAVASATLSVAEMSSALSSIVGVEMSHEGEVLPVSTHVAAPTGMKSPHCVATVRRTRA